MGGRNYEYLSGPGVNVKWFTGNCTLDGAAQVVATSPSDGFVFTAARTGVGQVVFTFRPLSRQKLAAKTGILTTTPGIKTSAQTVFPDTHLTVRTRSLVSDSVVDVPFAKIYFALAFLESPPET